MKRNMNFKSNRRTQKYTLADFNKARKSADFNVSLEEAYEIVAGYREINAKSPEARDLIYKRALKMVRDDDAEFAKLIVADNKKSKPKNKKLEEAISIKDAYDIVGGFKNVDSKTFENALKILEKHDPEFAKALMQMRASGSSFSLMSVEELKRFTPVIEKNTEIACDILSPKSLEQIENKVLEDKEVKTAFSNTPILDDKGVDLANEEKDEAHRAIVHAATLETIPEIVESTSEIENVQEVVAEKVKVRTLGILGKLRLEALRPKTSEFIEAVKEKNVKFFSNAVSKMRNAFNFKKKIKVSAQAVWDTLNKAKETVVEYSKKIAEATSSVKQKVLSNKVIAKAACVILLTQPVLSSCVNMHNSKQSEQQAKVENVDTTKVKKYSKINNIIQSRAKVEEVVVPTEYSDSLGLMSEGQWNRLQKAFNDGRPTFEKYYKMVTPEMRGDLTTTQYLFAYQKMGLWNLPRHKEALKQLDKYFECDEEITMDVLSALKEVQPDGSIKGVVGTLNRYATNRTIECGEAPVLNIKEVKTPRKKTVVTAPTNVVKTTVEEQKTPIETQEETVKTIKETVVEQEVASTDSTIVADSVTYTKPKVKMYKSNTLTGKNAVYEGDADIEDVLKLNVESKKGILTDQDFLTSNTTVTSATQSDAIKNDSVIYVDKPFSFSSVSTDTVNVDDDVVYVDKPFHFKSTATMDSIVAEWAKNETAAEIQIIAGSDQVELGTPAADDVPERGGYLNKGLTRRQYEGSQTRIKNRFGENAYEEFAERITPEMRAKGGIFEGLSIDQSMYTVEKMILWSNDKNGEFAEEIRIVTDYLKGCTDVISTEDASSVKAVIDRVNTDGTIDGVIGKKNVMARYYQVGDCGETGKYDLVKINGKNKTTYPTAPDFPRFFMLKNKAPEGFVEIEGEDIIIKHIVEKDTPVDPKVQIYKSNTLTGKDPVLIGDASIEDVLNLKVESKKDILIDQDFSSKKTPKKDKKKSKKEKKSVSKPDARADYFKLQNQSR